MHADWNIMQWCVMGTGFHSDPLPNSHYHCRNTSSTLIFFESTKHKLQNNPFRKASHHSKHKAWGAFPPCSSSSASVRALSEVMAAASTHWQCSPPQAKLKAGIKESKCWSCSAQEAGVWVTQCCLWTYFLLKETKLLPFILKEPGN